jgi:acetyl esterase/lipase
MKGHPLLIQVYIMAGVAALCGLLTVHNIMADSVIVEKDLVYGVESGYQLKLDLARPEKVKGPFAAIVFIHGGGFGLYPGLGRTDYSAAISVAAEKGYVAVTIDHRSIAEAKNGRTKYPFPAQINDAKCAVRWLRANAKKYHIDSERIGAIGYSSGGYLALMLGLTSPSDGFEGEGGNQQFSSSVQGVVNIAGTLDFESPNDEEPFYVAYFGAKRSDMPQNYEKAKPLNYVRKGSPPILTIQGDQDDEIPLSQSQTLNAKCKSVGISHSLIVIEGAGHGEAIAMWNDSRIWDIFRKRLGRKSILNAIGIYL